MRYKVESFFTFSIHPPPHVPNLLFRFQNCDPFLLTSQSHVAPGSIGPRSDRIGSFFFENNFCRGKAVENRFHRGAAVGESDPAQDTGGHELHPFPEFSVFEPVTVGYLEMVPCFFHSFDAVHPENSGERGFLVLVGYQIEVEFRKKEGHRLHGVLPFGSVLPLVVKADDFFLFYEKGNAPQG